jgi:hypothetical protein
VLSSAGRHRADPAAALLNLLSSEGASMAPQLITEQDEENYGTDLISMIKRAAVEALSPELQQLRAENQQLRHLQHRQQHIAIEGALDRSVPDWRSIYSNPAFSQWLSLPDDYSGGIRSQLMRHAVANGDAARVVNFYRGFQQEAGQPQSRSYQPRRSPQASGNIYTRPQIKSLYEQRARGVISDARWGPIEADIVKAAAEGRVAGAVNLSDGTAMSRWVR